MNDFVCEICGEESHKYLYMLGDSALWQCSGCGLITSQSHSAPDDLYAVDGNQTDPLNSWIPGRTETEASKRYLEKIVKHIGGKGSILLVAPHEHCLSHLAKEKGLRVAAHLDIREFEQEAELEENLDAIVFLYQLEKSSSLKEVFEKAHQHTRIGGILLVITPSLDSRSARFFRASWTEWRPENNFYFNNITIQSALLRYGFNGIQLDKDFRWYTLAHIYERASMFPKTWVTRLIRLLYRILPLPFHNLYFRLPSSGRIVIASKSERHEKPILSIILPVFNESATFKTLIEQLLAKRMNNIDKEIIIVESNSTDNSRELVMNYKDRPGVKIILQDKPHGKGNAVREGLDYATGDVVLIQDADLEYDLNDYEALVEPVISFRKPFVLGARHGGNWKMRHFNDQTRLATYFNFGHVLFTGLLNLLYGQRMKDPFTMFKVFHRDCLYNLKFECDRFDFDFELVIKLIRKGYTPVEIPVNYYSRSYKEGKKVDMFRDPFTWLRASFKYRFAKITKD